MEKKCNCHEPYDAEYFENGFPYCPIHDKSKGGMPPLEEPILSDEDIKAWEKDQRPLSEFEENTLDKTFQRSLKDKPSSFYQPLFDHMQKEHNITLLESEMSDIIVIVNKMNM